VGVLQTLNSAVCPHCGKSNTVRGGVVREAGKAASLWRCKEEDCGREFFVPMIVFYRASS